MDWSTIRDAVSPPAVEMQLRQAMVVSVEAGATCTITLAGATVAGVKYVTPPRPGTACWVTWQGGAPLVTGSVADTYSTPVAVGINNSTVSLANNTWTDMPNGAGWGTWNNNAWGMLDAAGVFTAPCDGWWLFTASAQFASNATGFRGVRIVTGGGTVVSWTQVQAITTGVGTAVACSGGVGLAKGSAMSSQIIQNSGAALNTGHMQFSVSWHSG